MVSRRDGVCWVEEGGAGIPETLLLRVDIGASRCARCDALVDVGCIDCRVPGPPNSFTFMSRTLIVEGRPELEP